MRTYAPSATDRRLPPRLSATYPGAIRPLPGERLPVAAEAKGLTQHVRKAGCASKIGQEDLLGILSKLPAVADPAVLVGTAAGDDAGVYQLSEELALVQGYLCQKRVP